MHRNAIWIAFLITILAITFWVVFKGGCEVYRYFRLNTQASAFLNTMQIQKVGENRYAITAKYFFYHQGIKYENLGTLSSVYPNPWAAEYGREQLMNRAWTVWFDCQNPEHAALIKQFPKKSTLSSLLILALTTYFFYIGFVYAGVSSGSRPSIHS